MDPLKQFSELWRDVLTYLKINQRVESTVQTHKATTDLMSDIYFISPAHEYLPFGQNSWPHVEILEDMKWYITNGEEKDQDEQQFQAPLFQFLVNCVFIAEKSDRVSVAADDYEEREAEPRDGPDHSVFQVIFNVIIGSRLKTFLSVIYGWFSVEHVWHTLSTHQQPNQDRDQRRVGASYSPHHPHRMDDGQVPVHADTSEEPNAAVQIQVEAESCYLARDFSKGPSAVVEVVKHQKWEREQIQKICKSKVEDKHFDIPKVLPVVEQRFESPSICAQSDY